jgi:hypothetical protein
MSNRVLEIANAFAGIHMMATTMDHTGDTAMVSDRGSSFAARYLANESGSVYQAWLDSMSSIAGTNSFCRSAEGTSYGGGQGFNGCGAHKVTAFGGTSISASNSLNETWIQLQDNTRDATGDGYYHYFYRCNYACATWPFWVD